MMRVVSSKSLAAAAATVTVLFTMIVVLMPQVSEATHFRYGTYRYERKSIGASGTPVVIEFYTEHARRWTYPAYPRRAVGDYINLSQGSTTRRWNFGDGTAANLEVKVESVNQVEDWFIATQTIQHSYPAQSTYTVTFSSCCRISTLRDSNNDERYYLSFDVDTRASSPAKSPSATGLPVVFFKQNTATATRLPVISSDPNNALTYELTPTGNGVGRSGLDTAKPSGLTLSSDGLMSWYPTIKGLYAVQLRIRDAYTYVVLDFILNVAEECSGSNCNNAPLFDPPTAPTVTAYVGVERSFSIKATDPDGDTVSISTNVMPDGAVLLPCAEGGSSSVCTRTFRWTPSLGQTSAFVCFQATDGKVGGTTTGLYCADIQVNEGEIIYLSGIVRDFHKTPADPDFNRPNADRDNGKFFVKDTLGSDGKPQYQSISGAACCGAFDNWFNDVAGVNSRRVHSITLNNAGQSDKRIYEFKTSDFFPIDDLLFGNEGDNHNYFFTYEINTYLTYEGGERFLLTSVDDMFIFINGKLASNNMQGMGTKSDEIVLDTFAAANGMVIDQTYRVDIFYAHRSAATTPSMRLQMSAFCNPIASGVDAVNFDDFSGNSVTNNLVFYGGVSQIVGDSLRLLDYTAALSAPASASAWYATSTSSGKLEQPVKFGNGFRTEFLFQITPKPGSAGVEGLTFVLSNDGVTWLGPSQEQLGYSGMKNSLVVEFDSNSQASVGDPAYDHVSVHTRFTAENSVQEEFSIGRSESTSLNFNNGTVHRVAIEYTPAQDDGTSGPQLGFIRIFLGTEIVNSQVQLQIVPYVQAQVDGSILKNMFADGQAFVGFTGATSATHQGHIDIRQWDFVFVPPSQQSIFQASPARLKAGETGSITIQAKDSCGNNILLGGDASRFSATLTVSSLHTSGPPPPPQTLVLVDNDDGTYTISYSSQVSGIMDFAVKFDGVDIANSPQQLVIDANVVSAAQSSFRFGQRDEAYSNFDANVASGFWIAEIDETTGVVLKSNTFNFVSDPSGAEAAMNTRLGGIGSNRIVAIVVKGSAWSTPISSVRSSVTNSLRATLISSLAADQSYALISSKSASVVASPVEQRSAVSATSTLSLQIGSGNSAFTVYARSAGTALGNLGYIQVNPAEAPATAGVDRTFTVVARDAYGNINTGGLNWADNIVIEPQLVGGSITTVSDNSGYTALKFSTTLAGSYVVSLSANGQTLPLSPYPVAVAGGVPVKEGTKLEGTGLFTGVSGDSTSTSITAKLADQYGNEVNVQSEVTMSIRVVRSGASTITSNGVWNPTTTKFDFSYTPTVSGVWTLTVVFNGQDISTTYSPEIIPGAVDATNSFASGAGFDAAVAGVEAVFIVQAVDAAGNSRTSDNPDERFKMAIGGTQQTVVALGDGRYQVRYTYNTAGALQLDVTYKGTTIGTGNTPKTITVSAGAASALSTVTGLTNGVAGIQESFTISSIDAFTNLRAGPGDESNVFSVVIRAVNEGFVASSVSTSFVSGNNYRVDYTATRSGTYTVSVQVIGVGSIVGSDQTVTIAAGATNASRCVVTGPGLNGGVGDKFAAFTVLARDKYDNVVTSTTDTFQATVTDYNSAVTQFNSVNIGAGQYKINYTIPTFDAAPNDKFRLVVRLTNGNTGLVKDVTASVIQNDDSSYAEVEGAPLSAVAGVPTSFTVKDKTKAGSVITDSTAVFVVTIESNSSAVDLPSVQNQGSGVFLVSFTATVVDTYRVRLLKFGVVETEQTSTQNIALTVGPGAVSPLNSDVNGFPKTLTAGTHSTFTVQLRDAFNNKISDGGHTISIVNDIAADGATIVSQTTNSEFQVIVEYFSNIASTKLLQIREATDANVNIGGSRYSLVVNPGPADPAQSEATGVTGGTAGVSSFFTIVARDSFRNPVGDGATLAFSYATASDIAATATFGTRYSSGGQYITTFTPQTSGDGMKVGVSVTASTVPSSPYLVDVKSSFVNETKSTITGLGSVTAGTAFQFTIAARDRFGNTFIETGFSTIGVQATPPGAIKPDTASVTLLGNGQYQVTYSQTSVTGTYSFQIIAQGVPFSTIRSGIVVPSTADASQTTINAPSSVSAGVPQTIVVRTRDRYGNTLVKGSTDSPSFTFLKGTPSCDDDAEPSDSLPISAAFSQSQAFLGSGAYNLTFSGIERGTFALNMSVLGTVLPCDRIVEIQVLPGVANGSMSEIVGASSLGGKIGIENTISVTAKDMFGNTLQSGGDTVALGVAYPSNSVQANWISAAVAQNITIVDANDGTYSIKFTPTTAGTYVLVVTINSQLIISPVASVTYSPGEVAQFIRFNVTNVTAGIPSDFRLLGEDIYGNPVTTGTHTYSSNFVKLKSAISYTFDGTAVYESNGVHRIEFLAAWHGIYDGNVQLVGGIRSPRLRFDMSVNHATCAFANPSTPFRCPKDRKCVASYTDCTDLAGRTCEASNSLMPVRCWDESCAASPYDCPCPAGQVRCDAGHCVTDARACPEAPPCTGEFNFSCTTGECRKSAVDCPSILVCPPGYLTCPNGNACVLNATQCITVDNGLCADILQTRCSNGMCVDRLQDCPSRTTCGSNKIVCPDGSCASSGSLCPSTYVCYAELGTPIRCPDGSCRANANDCPFARTCPDGWVRCDNQNCATSFSDCPAITGCTLNQTRCADGTCRENTLLCASVMTCPANSPVRCSNGECVSSESDCIEPNVCPSNLFTCADGSCAVAEQYCPVRTACPFNAPVLCPDGECKTSLASCQSRVSCPTSQPVRCPDGACRGSLADCPTGSFCADSRPVRCLDGKCVASVDQCRPVADVQCASGQIRCPGGECAFALQLCPTHVTCPLGSIKCPDGTCRSVCATAVPTVCQDDQVTCPQAGPGVFCAAKLSDCPLATICPDTKPVKCIDAQCAATLSDCPAAPSTYPSTKVGCADGSFETSAASCGTPVTCPDEAPYKCYDQTCRKNPKDCPIPPTCPSERPYLCPDSTCRVRLTDCQSPDAKCAAETPVRCTNGDCVAALSECPSIFPDQQPDIECPFRWVRCRDGSCKRDSTLCSSLKCPSHIPYRCSDGLCAVSASQCTLDNGCPSDQPTKCWNGACVAAGDSASCTTQYGPDVGCPVSGDTRCPDGSCAPVLGLCPGANGCEANLVRCHDKTCVSRPLSASAESACASKTGTSNLCPSNRPYRCARGFCAISVGNCPRDSSGSICPESKPVACDDGSCRLSSDQCPIISPCSTITPERCDDGSCRAIGSCPAVNTCPAGSSRCTNGLCAPINQPCMDDKTGCPANRNVRCENSGACVQFLSECSDSSLTNPPPKNGCPSTSPVKCQDGSCAASTNACPSPNGCPKSTPFRCNNGTCVADSNYCKSPTALQSCPLFKCANGACAANPSNCTTSTGCPVTRPHRCGDGTCRKYASHALSIPSRAADACPLSLTCDDSEVRCADGSCAPYTSLCPAFVPCSGSTPILCADLSCAAAQSSCPIVALCPSSKPVRCNSGECKRSLAECSNFLRKIKCSGSTEFKCFDGSCRASPFDCISWSKQVNSGQTSVPSDFATQSHTSTVCVSATDVLCPDGSCVPADYQCSPVPACPVARPYRCSSSACVTDAGSCGDPPAACSVKSESRCEDGTCRASCLPYNGCPLSSAYMCPDRSCALSLATCPTFAQARIVDAATVGKSYHAHTLPTDTSMLSQFSQTIDNVRNALHSMISKSNVPYISTSAKACTTNCLRDIDSSFFTYSVDSGVTSSVTIADREFVTQSSLVITSGALGGASLNLTGAVAGLEVRPVSSSVLQAVRNPVTGSRAGGIGRFLAYGQTVLSSPFTCVLPTVSQTPGVPLTVESRVDVTSVASTDDICLGTVVQETAGTFWRCTYRSRAERLANPVWTSSQPADVMIGVVTQCGTDAPHAFIHSPLDDGTYAPEQDDFFWQNPWFWGGVGIAIGVAIIVFGSVYLIGRLYRYRKKLHAKRKQAEEMQAKVDDMEMYGGEMLKDQDADMIRNPLALTGGVTGNEGLSAGAPALSPEEEIRRQQRQQHRQELEEENNNLRRELAQMQNDIAYQAPASTGPQHIPFATYSSGYDSAPVSAVAPGLPSAAAAAASAAAPLPPSTGLNAPRGAGALYAQASPITSRTGARGGFAAARPKKRESDDI
jgi:fibro-slime domain-containing protein